MECRFSEKAPSNTFSLPDGDLRGFFGPFSVKHGNRGNGKNVSFSFFIIQRCVEREKKKKVNVHF
jgi:hypothetical protein